MVFERRSTVRYPIILNARYQALKKRSHIEGAGKTIDMSSRGLWVVSERSVPLGVRLIVTLDWPALLDNATELLLVAFGQVVRSREEGFALELSRYEFRTTRRKSRTAFDGSAQLAARAKVASAAAGEATAAARFRVPELST